MSTQATVVGEGSYGCVHSPPLFCKGETVQDKTKLSKLMKEETAISELKEYKIMKKVDPTKKYYLGKPRMCDFETNNKYNIRSVKGCKNLYHNDEHIFFNLRQYKLHIMNNGGDNLETFANNMNELSKTPANIEKMEKFWIEAQRMLIGLKVLLDNGAIHHDLKAQNIVYNKETNRINFIDFGLMTRKESIKIKAKESKYDFSIHHWSFPLETYFLDKKKYDTFSKYTFQRKSEYLKKIIKEVNESESAPLSDAILTFLSQITSPRPSDTFLNRKVILKNILDEYSDMILNSMLAGDENYNEYLNKCIDTIDLYGVGLAYLQVIKETKHLVDEDFGKELKKLLSKMLEPNYSKRINVDDALNEYESILEKYGLMEKHNLHFENHEIKEGKAVPERIEKLIENIDNTDINDNIREINKRIKNNEEILNPQRICPPGKVVNPITNRCIKIKQLKGQNKTQKNCPPGKVLNTKTNRCVKEPKIPTNSLQKNCPPGKVLNTKTNRCIKIKQLKGQNKTQKICPPGKILYPPTNRCIKIKITKTKKNPNVKDGAKKCPNGKEMNPNTNRCVKKCSQGQTRNSKFKCVNNKTRRRSD